MPVKRNAAWDVLKITTAIDRLERHRRIHCQVAGAVRLSGQRRQCHDPLSVQLQFERLARNPVVHVRRSSCCSAPPRRLRLNEHVRVDLLYSAVSDRARLWIDIIRHLHLPAAGDDLSHLSDVGRSSWTSFESQEFSSNAGGLILWPVKLCCRSASALLRAAGARRARSSASPRSLGVVKIDTHYEAPLQ